MDFTATVHGRAFHIVRLNHNNYLVTGDNEQYIVYKTAAWKCAEEMNSDLLEAIGETIESRLND
jgi:hypothetical protein